MEGIAPPLRCLIEVQSALQNGESIRSGLLKYISGPEDDFSPIVRRWLFAWDQGHDCRKINRQLQSIHRRALLDLLAQGLTGQPIQAHLKEMELEITLACELEIKKFVDLLPLRMLVPLLLFQFPGFLILLFGPVMSHFMTELNR